MNEKLETLVLSHKIKDKSVWQKTKDQYFEPKNFERWKNGRVYEWLGVRKYKSIVTKVLRRPHYFLKKDQPVDKSIESFEKLTRYNEGVHLFSSVFFNIACVSDLCNDKYEAFAFWGATNIILNIYPVMMQRYNRARIRNVQEEKRGIDTYNK